MLATLFAAGKREGVPCLPYARKLIRQGLRAAGNRLDQVDPLLCQQLLARCPPVLLLLDEADCFAVPSLPAYAATVPGRGLSLWVAVPSLSELDGVYGPAGALAVREALESHVYHRLSDLASAQSLEDRLGEVSAYAHGSKGQDGARTSEGRSERPVPLLVAQEVLQLPTVQVLVASPRIGNVTGADFVIDGGLITTL
jgi:type IV secretory pathway TraG/TraD family ATPase VirD4